MNAPVPNDPKPLVWRLVIGLLAGAWLIVVTHGGALAAGPMVTGGIALLVAGIVWIVIAPPWMPALLSLAAGVTWLAPTLSIRLPAPLSGAVLAPALWPLDVTLLLGLVLVLTRRWNRRFVWSGFWVLLGSAIAIGSWTILAWDPFFSLTCELSCHRVAPVFDPGPDGRVLIRNLGGLVTIASALALSASSISGIAHSTRSTGRFLLSAGGLTVGCCAGLLATNTLFDPGTALAERGFRQQAVDVATNGVTVGAAIVAIGLLALATTRGRVRRRLRLLAAGIASAPERGGVADALANALSDPAVRIAYFVDEQGTVVGRDGASLPPDRAGTERTMLRRAGQPLAVIVHASSTDPSALTDELGPGIMIVLETERLRAASLVQLRELQASRQRIVAVADAERRRIERNLHDGAQQRLLAIAMELRLLRDQASGAGTAERVGALRQAESLALGIIEELRRIGRGIYPAILAQAGLGPALRSLADETSIPLELEIDLPVRMPTQVEAAAFAVVAELSSQLPHDDRSRLEVTVAQREARLHLAARSDLCPPPSLLERLRDRVGAVGGDLAAVKLADGGTLLTVELPCG